MWEIRSTDIERIRRELTGRHDALVKRHAKETKSLQEAYARASEELNIKQAKEIEELQEKRSSLEMLEMLIHNFSKELTGGIALTPAAVDNESPNVADVIPLQKSA